MILITALGKAEGAILKNKSRATIEGYEGASIARQVTIEFTAADVESKSVSVITGAQGEIISDLICVIDAVLWEVENIHAQRAETSNRHFTQRT